MDNIVKKYLEICNSEFSQYGFKQHKRAFVRVVNDVVQIFAIEKSRFYKEYKVVFAIIPLCLRIEKHYVKGSVYSKSLRRLEYAEWALKGDCWKYDPKSNRSIDECVESIITQVTKHLIPLFKRADSCKTAYNELCEVDKIVFGSIKPDGSDSKYFKDGVFLLDNVKYYIALKNGNYDIALDYLRAFEQQNEKSFDSIVKMGYLKDKECIRREKILVDLRKEIERISKQEEHHMANLQKLLKDNEEHSITNLSKFIT